MDTAVGLLEVIAMLGMFILAFLLWVAWELITGRKLLALLLAIGTFVATWLVADAIGADAPVHFFVAEAIVAAVIFRVANRGSGRASS